MPIEQLLAMYYQNGDQANTDQEQDTDEKENQQNVSSSGSGSDAGTSNVNATQGVDNPIMNGDADDLDPFQNQRITRGRKNWFCVYI